MKQTNWEWTDIDKIRTDGQNPNRMSNKEKEALKQNLIKYEWNMPIITDMDYLIADGEQKFQVAKEMGLKQVPILRKEIDDNDRRIIRQSMNKIGGSHNDELDAEEYKRILQNTGMEELSQLTSINEQDILNSIQRMDEEDKDLIKGVNKLGSMLITCPHCKKQFKKEDSIKK